MISHTGEASGFLTSNAVFPAKAPSNKSRRRRRRKIRSSFAVSGGILEGLRPVVRSNNCGGVTHRSYRAQYEKKTVLLNVYAAPDGRYEQFLVEESF